MNRPGEEIRLDLGPRSYSIHVGVDLLARTGAMLAPLVDGPRAIVITDENVAVHYLRTVLDSLGEAGIDASSIVLPPGEASKSFVQLEALIDTLLERRIERTTTLIALGGGVVGDICGFASSIVLRGVSYVQVPTTLLAQVDSSVGGKTGINTVRGGKTGINTVRGKNLVGTFYQPRLVIADTDTLNSLPEREIRAGFAEIIKYGLINDAAFFSWLEENGASLLGGDGAARCHAVAHCCRAKAAIVAADETEAGQRALLNLGHTFAHALEAEAGYDGGLLHGEAVALGIQMAFDLSARLGLCPAADARRARALFEASGLPGAPGRLNGVAWNTDALLGHMATDKKVRAGQVTFILSRGIGKSFIARQVSLDEVRRVIDEAIAA